MEKIEMKFFLKMFLPLIDRNKGRAALRCLFRHTIALNIRKGETLFPKNISGTNGQIIMVCTGLVNGFLQDNECGKINIWLGKEGSIYICQGQNNARQENFNLEAIEDTIVFLVDYEDLEDCYQSYPELAELFYSYLLPHAMNDVSERNIIFRLPDVACRIMRFQKAYPGLYERLPKNLLLSYALCG
ncbi:hypothetical protein [Pedobacter sp. KLB.chiD]|uniref:hypothetical protein n=1 Tax=Pedobacter sp. KLB.chiD TaxID=3387402 RepID=UPI00399B2024